MKRIFIFAAVLLAIFVLQDEKRASAAPPYDYEYSPTNLYNQTSIFYEFSGLDATQTYIWYIYTVDDKTGLRKDQIGFRVKQPSASTTHTWAFGGSGVERWPTGYSGPIQVLDHFGNILGKHYVTPSPILIVEPWANPDWFCTVEPCGETSLNNKHIVSSRNTEAGECQSPVYADLNAAGWHHTEVPCSVLTLHGDYALLHFIIDPADYPAGNDHIFSFFLVPDDTPLLSIALDDIEVYQHTPGYSVATSYLELLSFIVINTSGNDLPFIDQTVSEQSFITEDNPHTASFAPGVYSIWRESIGSGWVSDSESTWIVSEDANKTEWTITAAADAVGEGGNQTLITRAVTEEVWASYNGYQEVADVYSGYSNTTVYSFLTQNTHTYQVSNTAADGVEVTWTNGPADINSGEALPSERYFVVSDTFNIDFVRTIEETIQEVIEDTGFDTDLGRNVLLLLVLFTSLLIPAMVSPFRTHVMIYLISWTAFGGIFVISGFATGFGTLMFLLTTIMAWVLMIPLAGKMAEENGD